MATSSEIKVTQAYIGLFGRAPDPDGLAYWAEQLDNEIAAGKDADVALKELTAGMTANTEWTTDGLGATGTTNAAVINTMYSNLFGRSPSAAERDYWLDSMEENGTTASEMVVQLVQGAGAVDSEVLGYKQEAATYYVENVAQDDFDRTSAGSSVSSVDGPRTLESSKEATDILASGVGNTIVIGTDTITMTLGDDTVTGEIAAGKYVSGTTEIADASTSDADTLTLTGTDDFDFGVTTNVETVGVTLTKQFTTGDEFDIDADDLSGGDLTITTSATTTVAEIEVAGVTEIDIENVRVDVNTVGVTTADIDMNDAAGAFTITGDASLTTLNLDDANDAGVTIVMANDGASQSITLSGDGANDVVTIKANNAVALDAGSSVDDLVLSGNTNDVTYTLTNATPADMDLELTGSKNVTVKAAAGDLTGATITSSATGTTTLDIITGGTLDLTDMSGIDSLDISADMGGNTLTVAGGTSITISDDVSAQAGIITVEEAGATASAGDLLDITLDGGTNNAIAAGQFDIDGFESFTMAAGNNTVTALVVDVATGAGNDATFTYVGTNDVTFAADTGKSIIGGTKNITVSADSITAAGDIDGNDIVLTATNEVSMAAEDINAVSMGSVTITAGTTVDVNAIAVDTGAVTAGENITISGNDVDVAATLEGYDITLTATNDADTSVIGGDITAANNLSFTDGNWDLNGTTVDVTGLMTVSGDAKVDGAGLTALNAAGIIISSSGVTNLTTVGVDTPVFNASGATNDVSVNMTPTGGDTVVQTGTGNDTVTLNAAQKFTVTTSSGDDTVNITQVAASTVVNTGAGDDTIADTDTGVIYTVSTGDGDDTISVDADSDATYDGGNDTDSVSLETGDYSDDTFNMKNVEKVTLEGDVTINASQFGNDNTYELLGANNTLTVDATGSATGVTIDASNLTFNIGSVADVALTGSASADTITGSINGDVISGAAGNDSMTGGEGSDVYNGAAGADTFTLTETTGVADYIRYQATTEGSAAGAAAGTFTGYDTIVGFASGSDEIVFDSGTLDADATVGTGIASAEFLYASTAGSTDALDLTASEMTDVDSVVDFLNDATGTDLDTTDAIVVITVGADSWIYYVDNNDADVAATEVKLLAHVDGEVIDLNDVGI